MCLGLVVDHYTIWGMGLDPDARYLGKGFRGMLT